MWRVFVELRRRVRPGFSGAQPIGWDDLAGWQAARRARLTPWEIDRVFQLDDIWLNAHAEPDEPKPTPKRPA